MAPMEGTHANQDPTIADDSDLDVLLLSDFPIFDMDSDLLPERGASEPDRSPIVLQSSGPPSTVQSEGGDHPRPVSASSDCVSSYVNYVEKFLMDDVDWSGVGEEMGEDIVTEFFSGVFLADLGSPKSDGDSPVLHDAVAMENNEEKKIPVFVGVEEDNDLLVSKKRRRQMRNRESAMISRERKKMHIKDLEMRSKNLYSECRRLEHVLRCCLVENDGLRQNLQFDKDKPRVAFAAKQESAVLFVESLLLGSLFWLVSLACFFLVPGRMADSRPGGHFAAAVAGAVSTNIAGLARDLELNLLRLRRRCRGARGRMKFLSSSPFLAVLS